MSIPVQISAIQHYVYCRRQCYLIHVEQLWSENSYTAIGRDLHSIVDSGFSETRNNVVFARSIKVNAEQLGIYGQLDLLEYDKVSKMYIPVEYKKGKPKMNNCDILQLVAQGLAVSEMMNCTVDYGYLWYYQVRRRIKIEFTQKLILETKSVIEEIRNMLDSQICKFDAKDVFIKKCKYCSLKKECSPQMLYFNFRINNYIKEMVDCEEIIE